MTDQQDKLQTNTEYGEEVQKLPTEQPTIEEEYEQLGPRQREVLTYLLKNGEYNSKRQLINDLSCGERAGYQTVNRLLERGLIETVRGGEPTGDGTIQLSKRGVQIAYHHQQNK